MLNWKIFNKITYDDFTKNKVFPFIEIDDTFQYENYKELLTNLPDKSLFEKSENQQRPYGQDSHDRLGYGGWDYEKLIISPVWKNFIDELKSKKYLDFLKRLFKTSKLSIRFMWHYASSGQSVSPHFDGRYKLGSHIFYFNFENWNPEWGGQTVLCFDDHNKIKKESAPRIEDFSSLYKSKATANSSLIFQNSPISWHAVSALKCPTGHYRKVFIVVIEKCNEVEKIKRYFFGNPARSSV
jgi:hypothetical protein